jgi:hypothetical protein
MKKVTDHIHRHFFIAILCIICTVFGLVMLLYARGLLFVNAISFMPESTKITLLSVALVFTGFIATKHFFARHKDEKGGSSYRYH